MIVGIGTDIIEIERFQHWADYPVSRLGKIFSPGEISYCLTNRTLAAQRFAVRFAAKEALYKALCASSMFNDQLDTDRAHPESNRRIKRENELAITKVQFFNLCRMSEILMIGNAPSLKIDWTKLQVKPMQVHVSLSHNKTMAQAFVILELTT